MTGKLKVVPGQKSASGRSLHIDLLQARFWITSGWPTIRESSRGGSNRRAECASFYRWGLISADFTSIRITVTGG